MRRPPFVPPASMDEAERRHAELVAKTQDIDFQLGQRRPSPGTSAAPADLDWRSRAVCAKQMISADARDLKLWLKAQRRIAHALTTGIGAAHSDPHVLMLSRAYRVLKQLACAVDFSLEEQAELDALHAYLQRCSDPEAGQ